MQARLSHQGAPRGISLTTASGRARLAALELSAGRRTVITTGLAVLDNLDEQLAPLDAQLISFAKRQRGFKALLKLYGVGYLTAAAILTELGDCRRFSNSDDAVRYSGLDITVYETNGKIAGHLSRQGPEVLRWMLYEAAQSAARKTSRTVPITSRSRPASITTAPAWLSQESLPTRLSRAQGAG